MTLLQLFLAYNPVLGRVLGDIIAQGRRHPELAPIASELAGIVSAEANADSLAELLPVVQAELKRLIATGKGPVRHDPVDLS